MKDEGRKKIFKIGIVKPHEAKTIFKNLFGMNHLLPTNTKNMLKVIYILLLHLMNSLLWTYVVVQEKTKFEHFRNSVFIFLRQYYTYEFNNFKQKVVPQNVKRNQILQ